MKTNKSNSSFDCQSDDETVDNEKNTCESTVYFDQDHEDDDSNFPVVSTLVSFIFVQIN